MSSSTSIVSGTSDAPRITIVLADDQTLVRSGIAGLLSLCADFTVVAEAADGDQAVAALLRHRPDVALLDVRMPRCTGIEAHQRARAAGFPVKTLLLTTFDDDEAVRAALVAGVGGYLLKDVSLDDLAFGIRQVAAGKTLLRPAVTARAQSSVKRAGVAFEAPAHVEPLTAREKQVLRLMAGGMSNREIAEALAAAEGTIKNHASSIFAKLGVRDRTRAVLLALERGEL